MTRPPPTSPLSPTPPLSLSPPPLGGVPPPPPLQQRFPRHPVLRNRVQPSHEVGDADEIDRTGEFLRREGQADQSRVAAIAGSHDCDTGRIGDLVRDRPVDGVD